MTNPSQPGGWTEPPEGWNDPSIPTQRHDQPGFNPYPPAALASGAGPYPPATPGSYPLAAPGSGAGPYPPAGPGAAAPYPAYGYPPVAASAPTNSLALTAMVLSLVGFATCLTAPVGAILGHVARRQLRERGESGEGMAKTAIIVGWALTAIGLLVIAGYVIFIVWAINHPDSFNSTTSN